jgi:CopG family nickel-responsive transcriptional regulator
MSLSSLHVHLDHDNCMEVTVLKGKTSKVQHFAEHLIAERGVRHGKLVMLPSDVTKTHAHGHEHPHSHSVLRPKRHG